ncbi:MAG: hypothetical protein A3B13_00585 [Candidatus Liptonbacteria bacterium RIFCSPLOWO2_01_FULL_45_15]|uniref:Uncharacterized protein n=1 Tax=Candidatus Liptonbacteria bacterium RIFCSPLOWO2_01_FULL_45_15 TaxID=1798649 RepID=A0A1G2CCS5_9BACT|nr:MAG: hypothetical protein A3B13_00585 [Candidatus Liptonbacteria bacterium RIFCSPLOWO2_01_FULL_45_15]
MTFFRPEQKSFINYAITTLIAICLIASLWIVLSYNRSVNLEHEISAKEINIRELQTNKAQLQDKMFTLLSDVNLKEFSRNRNLIEEKNPQYMRTAVLNGAELAVSQSR